MKKILCLMFALIIFMPLAARADDDRWVLVSQDENTGLYFDKQSISKSSRDAIYIVWVRHQYYEKYAQEMVIRHNLNKKQYKDYSHDLVQCEFDTANRRFRHLSINNYDANGNVIASSDSPSQWISPIPDTNGELIYNAVTAYILKAPSGPKTIAVEFSGFEGYLLGDTFDNIRKKNFRGFDFIEQSPDGTKEYMAVDNKGVVAFSFRANILRTMIRYYFDADLDLYNQKAAELTRLYGRPTDYKNSNILWEANDIIIGIAAYDKKQRAFKVVVGGLL